jgi:hypothetical protein
MAQVYVFQSPKIINPVYIPEPAEVINPSIQNVVGCCKQITLLILYQVSSKKFCLSGHNAM